MLLFELPLLQRWRSLVWASKIPKSNAALRCSLPDALMTLTTKSEIERR